MVKPEYCITNGHKFAKKNANGRWGITTNINIADRWAKKETAKSILNNSIPPFMRPELYVAEVSSERVGCQETLSQKQIFECRQEVSVPKEDSYKLSKYSFDNDENVQNMIEGFKSVRHILHTYGSSSYAKQIGDKVMRANLVLEDVKHYHGRKALSSRDGFRLNRLEDEVVIEGF